MSVEWNGRLEEKIQAREEAGKTWCLGGIVGSRRPEVHRFHLPRACKSSIHHFNACQVLGTNDWPIPPHIRKVECGVTFEICGVPSIVKYVLKAI